MKELIILILTFLGGFYVKQFFDNRDLRRKILEPVFEEFEKNIIYLQTEWRNTQAANINDKRSQEYVDTLNSGRDKLFKSKTNIIFACKKIEEKELIALIKEAFIILNQGMSGYSFFLEYRDQASLPLRTELIKTLKEANARFDETLPVAMEKVYKRYWKLISSTLILDTFKLLFQKIKGFKRNTTR